MYLFWWYKPQNVKDPEKIDVSLHLAASMSQSFLRLRQHFDLDHSISEGPADGAVPERSFLYNKLNPQDNVYTNSPLDETTDWRLLVPHNSTDKDVNSEEWSRAPGIFNLPRDRDDRAMYWGDDGYKADLVRAALNPKMGVVMLLPGQRLGGTNFICIKGPIHLTKVEVARLVFMSAPEDWLRDNTDHTRDSEYHLFKRYVEDPAAWEAEGRCLAPAAPNMLIPGGLELSIHWGLFILAVLSFLYGGVHALSWNSHFPSYVEQMLWRASAITIAGGGFGVWLLVYTSGKETNQFYFIFYVLLWFCPVAYGFARSFIVIEAFISVRSLPVGTYNTTSWSDLLPHIG